MKIKIKIRIKIKIKIKIRIIYIHNNKLNTLYKLIFEFIISINLYYIFLINRFLEILNYLNYIYYSLY